MNVLKKIIFGVVEQLRHRPQEVVLELQIEQKRNTVAPELDIDLLPCPWVTRISIVGNIGRDCGGQIQDQLLRLYDDGDFILADDVSESRLERICELWDRWHLPDLKAGTRSQEEYVRRHQKLVLEMCRYDFEFFGQRDPFKMSYYGAACAVLANAGLYEQGMWIPTHGSTQPRPYRYGEAWLVERVPEEVIEELCALFEVKI